MSGKVRFMSRSTSRGRHFYTNPPYRTRTGVEPKFWLQTGDFFAAWWGARGSAPPRRAAAAYGVAYLSTKCLGEVKSSSGRAAMFVAAKTFFVRNLEIGPHSHCPTAPPTATTWPLPYALVRLRPLADRPLGRGAAPATRGYTRIYGSALEPPRAYQAYQALYLPNRQVPSHS